MTPRRIGRRAGRVAAATATVALAAGASGCWLQPRYEPGRTGAVPVEDVLTPHTVRDLTELWSTEITLAGVAEGVETLAPVVTGDRAYAITRDELGAGIDLATGHPAWVVDLDITGEGGPPVWVDDPVFANGFLVYPYNYLGRLGGIGRRDPSTGAPATGVSGSSGGVANFAVVDDQVIAMRAQLATTSLAWASIDWPAFQPGITGFPNAVQPRDWAVVGDSIAWGNADEILGFRPQCPRWPDTTSCMASWTTELGAAAGNPTAVGDDRVAIADASGTLTVLEMATGAVLWQAELGATALSQPTVTGNVLLVATADGRLAAFAARGCGDRPTCAPRWEASLGAMPAGAAPSQVVTAGKVAYVGTPAGTVEAFALAGCATPPCASLATVDAGSGITGGPVVSDGRVLVGTASGDIVAFGLPG